jgi:hypothetical protein
MMTIDDARKILKDGYIDGVKCPCCEQWVKLYKRKITSSAAATLIDLYHQDNDAHISRLEHHDGGGDFAKLVFWGLIKDKRGLWRITNLGIDFVRRKATVQKFAMVLNGAVLGFEGPQVDIIHCLGSKFDYNELIGKFPS